MALFRGEFTVAGEADRTRRVLLRALAGGALGGGFSVAEVDGRIRLSGGAGSFSPVEITLSVADGRAAWEARVVELGRAMQGALVAAAAAMFATLVFGWLWPEALPSGLLVGAAFAVVAARGDRRRIRMRLLALGANLPLLGDEKPGSPP